MIGYGLIRWRLRSRPWRPRNQPKRYPAPHDRRGHVADSSRLANRGNSVGSTHHPNVSGNPQGPLAPRASGRSDGHPLPAWLRFRQRSAGNGLGHSSTRLWLSQPIDGLHS